MSIYPVNSCITHVVSVLFFCHVAECTMTTFFINEQNMLPNTLLKHVAKSNVFCVTYSESFSFYIQYCKAGFSGQAIF